MIIKQFRYHEVLLKCDGEPPLEAVQADVKRLREAHALLDSSCVGGGGANGAAENRVQALGEQVRAVKLGLRLCSASQPEVEIQWRRGSSSTLPGRQDASRPLAGEDFDP